jgi:hypothetical protein
MALRYRNKAGDDAAKAVCIIPSFITVVSKRSTRIEKKPCMGTDWTCPAGIQGKTGSW